MFTTNGPNENADWWLLADLILTLAVVAVVTAISNCCDTGDDSAETAPRPRGM